VKDEESFEDGVDLRFAEARSQSCTEIRDRTVADLGRGDDGTERGGVRGKRV